MDTGAWGLIAGAALLGVTHTALGPDHTLPFVMLARAQSWSRRRTLWVTFVCGLGHVAAALLLVAVGFAVGGMLVGLPVYRAWLAEFDGVRGSLAGWGFVAIGVAYGLWGIRHAIRRGAGLTPHVHDGEVHIHRRGQHTHRHPDSRNSKATFWMLFTLLVLGPCEPLIILFLPLAATGRWSLLAASGAVFALATVVTMLALVALAYTGLMSVSLGRFERWSHALAGGVIATCGLAVVFLGL